MGAAPRGGIPADATPGTPETPDTPTTPGSSCWGRRNPGLEKTLGVIIAVPRPTLFQVDLKYM